ncbi:MAG: hypothetical protein J7K40_13225 [candidate division Zixibacteria bacterium]|nr:hypothetical protein [candidate division Zixibacteria bacterium]
MRTGLIIISALLSMLIYTCDKPISQQEATDQEAIFNVVVIDNYRLSSLEIFHSNTTIPDTMAYIEEPDTLNPIFWHDIVDTEEEFDVNINPEPVETEYGSFYQASVDYSKTRTGIFNLMRYNNETDSLERFSLEFSLQGEREAVCQQWGSVGGSRRGWRLIEISDAEFSSSGSGSFNLDSLYYHADSNGDSVFSVRSRELDSIPDFDIGEQVKLNFDYEPETNLLLIYIPNNDYFYRLANIHDAVGGGYEVTFNMPSKELYGQLKFLTINLDEITERYKARGYSYNYHTE